MSKLLHSKIAQSAAVLLVAAATLIMVVITLRPSAVPKAVQVVPAPQSSAPPTAQVLASLPASPTQSVTPSSTAPLASPSPSAPPSSGPIQPRGYPKELIVKSKDPRGNINEMLDRNPLPAVAAGQVSKPLFGHTALYGGGAVPGFPGAAVIEGHIDSNGSTDRFWNLQYLKPGDTVTVVFSSGDVVTGSVTKTEAIPKYDPKYPSAPPCTHAGDPSIACRTDVWKGMKPVLRLITCYPHWFNEATGHYPDNLAVFIDALTVVAH